jgi:hypothetical protein
MVGRTSEVQMLEEIPVELNWTCKLEVLTLK